MRAPLAALVLAALAGCGGSDESTDGARALVTLGLTEPDILGALSELEAQVGRVLFMVSGHELMPTVHAWRFADALRSGAPLHFQ